MFHRIRRTEIEGYTAHTPLRLYFSSSRHGGKSCQQWLFIRGNGTHADGSVPLLLVTDNGQIRSISIVLYSCVSMSDSSLSGSPSRFSGSSGTILNASYSKTNAFLRLSTRKSSRRTSHSPVLSVVPNGSLTGPLEQRRQSAQRTLPGLDNERLAVETGGCTVARKENLSSGPVRRYITIRIRCSSGSRISPSSPIVSLSPALRSRSSVNRRPHVGASEPRS